MAIEVEPEDVQSFSGALVKAELDQQIATARAYPRSLAVFRKACIEMATLSVAVAAECIYALPRKDRESGETKMIEGPSARLAEIIVNSWGNCRAGSRVLEEGSEFVVAQGYFMDLERNVGIYKETRRRITTRNGARFSADMIAVTANAAGSIALRNAVFSGVPKAIWAEIYERARATVAGTSETFGKRRAEVLDQLRKMGVPDERIFAAVEVDGTADIGVDELLALQGIATAIRSEEISVDEAFPDPRKPEDKATTTGTGVAGLKDRLAASKPKPTPADAARSAAETLEKLGSTEAAQAFRKSADALEGKKAEPAQGDLMGEPRAMCIQCPNESVGRGPDGQPYCREHMPAGEGAKKKAKA